MLGLMHLYIISIIYIYLQTVLGVLHLCTRRIQFNGINENKMCHSYRRMKIYIEIELIFLPILHFYTLIYKHKPPF